MQQEDYSARFKLKDASSYDPLAAEFDRFSQRVTLPLARRMAELAGLGSNDRILDLGTGTGIVALIAAEKASFGGKIVGIDLSDGMLSVARSKASAAGLVTSVEFCRMDAEALAFDDHSFDTVLSLFALLHFPSPLSVLREVFRVLRPGGRLVLAVGSGPPIASSDWLAEGVRLCGRILAVRHRKLLIAPSSLNEFVEGRIPSLGELEESSLARHNRSRTREVPKLIREAGFVRLKTDWCGAEEIVETPEEFWDLQRTFSSIARKRLLEAAPEKVEALRSEYLEVCRVVQSHGGKLVYPFAAFYVVAKRPPA